MSNCNLKWMLIGVCLLIVIMGLYLAFLREKRNIVKGNLDIQDGSGNIKDGSFSLKFAIGIILIVIGLIGAIYCSKNLPGCEGEDSKITSSKNDTITRILNKDTTRPNTGQREKDSAVKRQISDSSSDGKEKKDIKPKTDVKIKVKKEPNPVIERPIVINFPANRNQRVGYMKYDSTEGAIVSSQPVGSTKVNEGGPENLSWNVVVQKSGRYEIQVLIKNPYVIDLPVWVYQNFPLPTNWDHPELLKALTINKLDIQPTNAATPYVWQTVANSIVFLAGETNRIDFFAPFTYADNRNSVRLPYFKKMQLKFVVSQ